MRVLHGYVTQNTLKTLYVLEELGLDYEFRFVDLAKDEQKTAAFGNLTPVRKAPVLQEGDETLFESGAICRYLANAASSDLYPKDTRARARVDQWMDFMSCHLGRWLNTLYFHQVVKPRLGLGEPDAAACEEADGFARQQLAIIDGELAKRRYLASEDLSIADLFAFAYLEQIASLELSLDTFPNVARWLDEVEARASVGRGRSRVSGSR